MTLSQVLVPQVQRRQHERDEHETRRPDDDGKDDVLVGAFGPHLVLLALQALVRVQAPVIGS